MLKAFRVFQSGAKLLDTAKQAGDKLEELHMEVVAYRDWLAKAISLAREGAAIAKNIDTASAFTQALGNLESS
eukprot:4833479-Lingulodinium_polyedra.AAC.1